MSEELDIGRDPFSILADCEVIEGVDKKGNKIKIIKDAKIKSFSLKI